MNLKKVLVGGVFTVAMFSLAGCSDDDPAPVPVEDPVTIFELPAPLAAQTAIIHIHDPLGIPTVTIAGQPADIELSATATRTGVGTVDLELSATNNSSRILFNLKAVVSGGNLGDMGTITGSDGTFDTMDYVRFGQLGLAVGDDADAGTMTISNIDLNTTAVDPLKLNFVLPTTHPLAITHDSDYDTDTLTLLDVIANDSTSFDMEWIGSGVDRFSGDVGAVRNGVISPDGQYVYYGSRNMTSIYRLDLTSGAYDTLRLLTGEIFDDGAAPDHYYDEFVVQGHVESVFMSPDQQTLYATMHTGDHVYDNGTNTHQVAYLVKIKRDTLEILDTLEIFDGPDEPQSRDMEITADSSTAVLVVESADETTTAAQLVVIDLDAMEISNRIDVSPAGTAAAPDPAPNNEPNDIALSANESTIYLSYRGEDDLYIVPVAGNSFTKMGTTITSYIHTVDMGPDGQLYVGGDNGLIAIDLANANAETVVHTGISEVTTFDFSYDGNTVYLKDDNGGDRLYAYDLTQDPPAMLDLDGDTTDMTVGESTTTFYQWNENLVVTPY